MKLFYRQVGRGTPLLILHGLFGMSDNWMTFAEKLADRYTVYIPDMRNHGRSGHDPLFNYAVMARDVGEFITTHQLQDVKIIGHSMGGKVAMEYVTGNGTKVGKLVIIDIAPKTYQNPFFAKLVSILENMDLRQIRTYSEADRRLSEKISRQAIRQLMLKNLYRNAQNRFEWKPNLQAIKQNMDKILDAPNLAGPYQGATLFVRGGQSDYMEDGDLKLIRAYFPRARIETISKANHWVHATAADELLHLLRNFL